MTPSYISNKILQVFGGFILGGFLTIAFIWGAFELNERLTFGAERYSHTAWHKSLTRDEEFACYRGEMAYDVMAKVLKPGVSRIAVEAELGKPDEGGGWTLGICGPFMEYHTLQPHYDNSDKLLSSEIVRERL